MADKGSPGGNSRIERPPAPRNDRRETFRRGTTIQSAEEQQLRLTALEEELETLRIHFEQYFLGLVRKPPAQERIAVRTAILQLKASFLRNTGVKFRVNSLHNRYLAYERMWDRTLREIEEGTYRRDLFKAKLHRARETSERPRTAAATSTSPVAPAEPALPEPSSSPAAPERGAGRPAAPGGLDGASVERIHAEYIEARRKCQQSTAGLTLEAVTAALEKQVPALLERHGAKSVEFRVSIQGGKAVLQAFPK